MLKKRHHLEFGPTDDSQTLPGSETFFDWIDRPRARGSASEAKYLRGLAHVGVALTALSPEEASTALKTAKQAGVPPAIWAPFAVLHGNAHALKALTAAGVDWATIEHLGEPILQQVCQDDRVEGALALLKSGLPATTALPTPAQHHQLAGEPTVAWVAWALEQRAFGVADLLAKNGAFDGPNRQDVLDRALMGLACAPKLTGPSAFSTQPPPDEARWGWWRRLVKLGANPLRAWDMKEQGLILSHVASALAEPEAKAWKAAAKGSKGQWLRAHALSPASVLLREVASKHSVHNPDWHATWRALDASVDWRAVPTDSWGLSVRAQVWAMTWNPSEVDAWLSGRGAVHSGPWSLPALVLAREAAHFNDLSGLSWEHWPHWVAHERREGRTPVLSLAEAAAHIQRCHPPFDTWKKISPRQVAEWVAEVEKHLTPTVAEPERAAWSHRLADLGAAAQAWAELVHQPAEGWSGTTGHQQATAQHPDRIKAEKEAALIRVTMTLATLGAAVPSPDAPAPSRPRL